jgi:hypothetical protein
MVNALFFYKKRTLNIDLMFYRNDEYADHASCPNHVAASVEQGLRLDKFAG